MTGSAKSFSSLARGFVGEFTNLGREGLGGKPVKRVRGSNGGMCLRQSLDLDECFENLGLKLVELTNISRIWARSP